MIEDKIKRSLNIHNLTCGNVKIEENILDKYNTIKEYLKSLNKYSYEGLLPSKKKIQWRDEILNPNYWIFHSPNGKEISFSYCENTTLLINEDLYKKVNLSLYDEHIIVYAIKHHLGINDEDDVYISWI